MIPDYTFQLISYFLKKLLVVFVLAGGLFGIVLIVNMCILSKTTLMIDHIPSKDGNLYHIWSGISGSDDEAYISHHLFMKNLNLPIDSITYRELLNISLIYMDTVPLSSYKQLPVKKVIILKSLNGWMKMRGHDHQNWGKIGKNEIAIIKKEENSTITMRHKKHQEWKYSKFKFLKNTQGKYVFQRIK